MPPSNGRQDEAMVQPYTSRADSIKKGRKIQKGKNQTKSKDIAVAKLHTTTSYLDSIKKGRMEDSERKESNEIQR